MTAGLEPLYDYFLVDRRAGENVIVSRHDTLDEAVAWSRPGAPGDLFILEVRSNLKRPVGAMGGCRC